MSKPMPLKQSLLRKRTRKLRCAAVTVEMACSISIAFFTFFAALEFCRVSMIRHSVELALYEGARQGIVPGAQSLDVQNQVQSIMRTIGVRNFTIDVTPRTLTDTTDTVTIRVRVPLDQNLFAPAFFFRGRELDRTFAMKREGFN